MLPLRRLHLASGAGRRPATNFRIRCPARAGAHSRRGVGVRGRVESLGHPRGWRLVELLLGLRRPHLAYRARRFFRRHSLAETRQAALARSCHLGRLLHRRQRGGTPLEGTDLVLVCRRPQGAAPDRSRRPRRAARRTLRELGRIRRVGPLRGAHRTLFLSLLHGPRPRQPAASRGGAVRRRGPLGKVALQPDFRTGRSRFLRRKRPRRAGRVAIPRLLLDARYRPRHRPKSPPGPGALSRRGPLEQAAGRLPGLATLGLQGDLRPHRAGGWRRHPRLVRRRRRGVAR